MNFDFRIEDLYNFTKVIFNLEFNFSFDDFLVNISFDR